MSKPPTTYQAVARRACYALMLAGCGCLIVAWVWVVGSEQAWRRAKPSAPDSDARIDGLTRALDLNPGSGALRSRRAKAYLMRGQFQRADADAVRAARSRDSLEATLQRASIAGRLAATQRPGSKERREKENERLALLAKARLVSPDSPTVLTQLAATLINRGRYAEAYEVATDLHERVPGNAEALYFLGLCAEGGDGLGGDATGRSIRRYRQALDCLKSGGTARIASRQRVLDRLDR